MLPLSKKNMLCKHGQCKNKLYFELRKDSWARSRQDDLVVGSPQCYLARKVELFCGNTAKNNPQIIAINLPKKNSLTSRDATLDVGSTTVAGVGGHGPLAPVDADVHAGSSQSDAVSCHQKEDF
jgi:hypothetical protein